MSEGMEGLVYAGGLETGSPSLTWAFYPYAREKYVRMGSVPTPRQTRRQSHQIVNPQAPRIRGEISEISADNDSVTVKWTDGTTTISDPADTWQVGTLERMYQHELRNGDYLRIFDRAEPDNLVWEGEIDFRRRSALGEPWVSYAQVDVSSTEWKGLFKPQSPAMLIPAR